METTLQTSLMAISPVDGRYAKQSAPLAYYFSEYALMHFRVRIEIEYFIALSSTGIFEIPKELNMAEIRKIWQDFSVQDAARIKEIEKITNHDVKAVEYFLREKLESTSLKNHLEFIHLGLTSQDVNNTAIPLAILECRKDVMLPILHNLCEILREKSAQWKEIPMLAKTHGQPASPTSLGKEFMVFVERLEKQIHQLNEIQIEGKFGGATGNFNAHYAAYPDINWHEFGNLFLHNLKLTRQSFTTQIEHYDQLSALFDCLKRINTILVDLCRDVWMYVSMNYFTQKTIAGEVGSSAMPHKVNPIDFENAEGNLGFANAILEFLSGKLPVSRLQRDLTDSTVLRNIGVPFAHALISWNSIIRGLGKLEINRPVIDADLNQNWAVLAEAIQTILRRENYPHPYEALKNLTRGKKEINAQTLKEFIVGLDIKDDVKEELLRLSPESYTGRFPDF
jgi:adenylosuccinate lyase